MATLLSRNPYTGEINGSIETINNTQLIEKIEKADAAYQERKNTSRTERKELFHHLANLLEANKEINAELPTKEMGRLYSLSLTYITSTANLIRRYADNAERILGDETFQDGNLRGHYQYDPLGVIFGIAPRNFPYNQLLRAAVPNILAGNTVVYKHASNVPLCAQRIQELFDQAGFPQGVYTSLFVTSDQSELIISHPAIKGVNLTGSEEAGQAIGMLAGKYLKPSILELGGNDAFVLLDHTDTDAMVAQAVTCRISNGGERCNASKRFIILEQHYDAFCEKISAYMANLKVGDPMDPETDQPPLAKAQLVQDIHRQVTETIQQGAKLLTGGRIIDADKNLYAPTVLADVTPAMTSYQQEVFGPVASIIKSSSVEQSIHIANNSDFGLSAVVFGDNKEECHRVARQLVGGMIFINQPAGSKASLPFGGIKKSGYGKENGPEGLKAFTNKKVVLY